jgi:hypothetical protein
VAADAKGRRKPAASVTTPIRTVLSAATVRRTRRNRIDPLGTRQSPMICAKRALYRSEEPLRSAPLLPGHLKLSLGQQAFLMVLIVAPQQETDDERHGEKGPADRPGDAMYAGSK